MSESPYHVHPADPSRDSEADAMHAANARDSHHAGVLHDRSACGYPHGDDNARDILTRIATAGTRGAAVDIAATCDRDTCHAMARLLGIGGYWEPDALRNIIVRTSRHSKGG